MYLNQGWVEYFTKIFEYEYEYFEKWYSNTNTQSLIYSKQICIPNYTYNIDIVITIIVTIVILSAFSLL